MEMAKHVIVVGGLGLALLGTLALEAAAQTSCSAWQVTCRERCRGAGCQQCIDKMAECRKTGCWLEGPQYGGKNNCKLKKS